MVDARPGQGGEAASKFKAKETLVKVKDAVRGGIRNTAGTVIADFTTGARQEVTRITSAAVRMR